MSQHPYKSLPPENFWRAAIAKPAYADVDPVVAGKFVIAPQDKVATAGSCFAQHIARHLRQSGFQYFVTEAAHPLVEHVAIDDFNYGTYSARFGNVYTTRQLRQLIERAYGLFTPIEDIWPTAHDRCVDPFRPQIQPDGFACAAELSADRVQHLASVRRMVEECDVFVFTLGLTESWLSREDGAVFPVCPGVSGGEFDAKRHVFHNFTVAETEADLRAAIALIRQRNPAVRFVLTVSPVPLVATAEPHSVLVSTTYSKSVLRVVAEAVSSGDAGIAYFPSYEIITGSFSRGRYFADDLRSVTEEGVSHVMRLFMRHYTAAQSGEVAPPPVSADDDEMKRHIASVRDMVRVICDEEALDTPVTP